MRTKEEIVHEISQCGSLPEIDELLKNATLEEFYMYHYEFLFGAYLRGIQIGELAKEEYEKAMEGGDV